MYDALVRRVSQFIIDGDDAAAKKCADACKRAFSESRALGRELTLLKSLSESTVSSRQEADRFVTNARAVASTIDWKRADAEAAVVVKALGEGCDLSAADDADHLLAEWRSRRPDVVRVTKLEESVVRKLQESKRVEPDEDDPGARDPLVEKLMVKKLNERYGDALSPRQRALLRELASADAADGDVIESSIDEARLAINAHVFSAAEKNDKLLVERLNDVIEGLDALRKMPPQRAAEGCMRLFALVDELSSKEE